MPTLKFRLEGLEFEYIGNNDEIKDFIHSFISQTMHLPEHEEMRVKRKSRLVITEKIGDDTTNVPLPPDEKIMEFLEGRENFSHDLTDVQKGFFGKVFSSRDAQRMYHRTARQLRGVRIKLEKKHLGNFVEQPTGIRNLKRYVFKPSQKVIVS